MHVCGGGLGAVPSALASLGLSAIHSPLGTGGFSGHAPPPSSYRGELDGKPVNTPYSVTSPFDRQRALAAALSDTIYAYDFIELFTRALEQEWSKYERQRGASMGVRRPAVVLTATELALVPKVRVGGGGSSGAADRTRSDRDAGSSGKSSLPPAMRRNASVFIDQFAHQLFDEVFE